MLWSAPDPSCLVNNAHGLAIFHSAKPKLRRAKWAKNITTACQLSALPHKQSLYPVYSDAPHVDVWVHIWSLRAVQTLKVKDRKQDRKLMGVRSFSYSSNESADMLSSKSAPHTMSHYGMWYTLFSSSLTHNSTPNIPTINWHFAI